MGDGLVLESGTHQDLLSREGGAYARLVAAQKLRENSEAAAAEGGDADSIRDEKEDLEKAAREEIPLGRKNTGHSLASEILEQKKQQQLENQKEGDLGFGYLFKRMGMINRDEWRRYFFGAIFATMTGMVYPAFGIVYGQGFRYSIAYFVLPPPFLFTAKGIDGFSQLDPHVRRHDGDRNALWFFLIAIVSTFSIGFQNYLFAASAATLTSKLRTLSFKAILRQDSEYLPLSRPVLN